MRPNIICHSDTRQPFIADFTCRTSLLDATTDILIFSPAAAGILTIQSAISLALQRIVTIQFCSHHFVAAAVKAPLFSQSRKSLSTESFLGLLTPHNTIAFRLH